MTSDVLSYTYINKNIIILTIVVVILIAGGVFFLNKKSTKMVPPTQTQGSVSPTSTAAKTNEENKKEDVMNGEQIINLTAKNFEFSQKEIKVKQGQKVKINITSTENHHGFTIPDYQVSADLQEGKEQSVEFTADKKGTFTFMCNVPCGPGHSGMKGTLIVE